MRWIPAAAVLFAVACGGEPARNLWRTTGEVEQLAAAAGQRVLRGDPVVDGKGGGNWVFPFESQVGQNLPATPGTSFQIDAKVRCVPPSADGDVAGVKIYFLDAANKIISTTGAPGGNDAAITCAGSSGAWTAVRWASAPAPDGVAAVRFALRAYSDRGDVTAQFDAVVAK